VSKRTARYRRIDAPTYACEAFDFDANTDIDLLDFAGFQNSFSTP